MISNAQVEFYNGIYRAKPGKWSNIERDYFAFRALQIAGAHNPLRMLDYGCDNGHTLAEGPRGIAA